MHTVTIAIDRIGTAHNHDLSPDIKYIASCQNQPSVDVSVDCDQVTFDRHKEMLRYQKEDETERLKGISFFERLITKLFDDIRPLGIEGNRYPDFWLHIRLLVNEKELVQLPFELTLTPLGFQGQHSKPFLLNPQRLTTMTREVKQVGLPSYRFSHPPRILFAWAEPNEAVPAEEHFVVLRDIVARLAVPMEESPEPIPHISSMITRLPKASLQFINAAIKTAITENKPYTHIHILAHGSKTSTNTGVEDFKLVLHDNSDETKAFYATGEDLAMAILETDGDSTKFPTIISLMACDSANTGNISLPAGSVAHQLHESGIPCVFASQFPLSVAGSIKLVNELYSRILIDAEDPRKILYDIRKAIKDNSIHDWASLIAYVRFPENIEDQMREYKLKVLLESLKTANAWSEHILKYKDQIDATKFEAVLENINSRLDKAINALNGVFKDKNSQEVNKEYYAEHSGLMGSAYKRKAEHLFRLATYKPDLKTVLYTQSLEALKTARDWYRNGFVEHRKSHWTGVQYLSLTAITETSLHTEDAGDFWSVVKVMANDCVGEDKDPMTRIWAWGTLIELYLLKPLTVPQEELEQQASSALPKAMTYASNLAKARTTFISNANVKKDDIAFAQASTARQIERYISWWPEMLPSAELQKLKLIALEIRKVLT